MQVDPGSMPGYILYSDFSLCYFSTTSVLLNHEALPVQPSSVSGSCGWVTTSDQSKMFVQVIQAPNLTHLKIANILPELQRIPFLAPSLQSLELELFDRIRVPEVAGTLSANLTSLVLRLYSNARARGLSRQSHQKVPELHRLSTLCPNLRHVSILGCTLDNFILQPFKTLHR